MLLCLDFGNTALKYAIFKKDQIIAEGVLSIHKLIEELASLVAKFSIQSAVLSSVIHHTNEVDEYLKNNTKFHRVSSTTKTNFSITHVKNPASIGVDRIALCCGAVKEAPSSPSYKLVIAAGTCITYNFLDIYNEFLGGGISPGIQLRYKSLHEHTHLLPLLNPPSSFPLIGYDTATNIHSGVLWGAVGEIDCVIELYQQRYKNLSLFLTGGDAIFLSQHIKNRIFADPNLIMKGLYHIANENI